VWKKGKRMRLQEQPFQVLRVLLERPDEIVTRDELKQSVWATDTFVDFDDGLNTAVKKIRDVLGDSAEHPRYIETIPRRGYRFIGELTDVRPVSAAASIQEREASTVHQTVGARPPALPAESRFPSARLKMVLGAVAALAVLIFALVLYHGIAAKTTKQTAIKSLAVLPLTNLSGNPTQEYFADGMTEAVIGRLSGIHNLRVISRTSVMRFKDTKLPVPEIAKTLGVDAIMEGSVIREGNRVRVHAQLIRAATDEHLWSEAYDRDLRDVLALQSDVAQQIAGKVEVALTGQEHARLAATRSVEPEVYESYLKGQFAKYDTKAEIEESIAHFEEAIKRDPTFAPAYVGLANAHWQLSRVFFGAPPEKERDEVVIAARKALELDPEPAEAHVLLAEVYQNRWQWSDAEAEYKRTLELKPNDAAANAGFARWLSCQGRAEEALMWARRGRELDPIAVWHGTNIASILFMARRYEEAIRELRSVLAVEPNDATALWYLGFVLIVNGQPGEAIPPLEKAVSVSDRSPGPIALLAAAYARAGRRPEALRLVNELKRRQQSSYVAAGAFIIPYLGLGDCDRALAGFEQAYQEKSGIMQFLKVHPFFDPVRDDPRFKDLLHRVGLG
jgi:TolB-like protein/DNA-binding winged helix-turn-helix (wHTH) protein/Flp pilus assembly protein TadD